MLQLAVAFAVVCLSSVSSLVIYDVQHVIPIRSCDSKSGVVCLPSACLNATCSILPEATCITDRCGCDARFFYLAKDKSVKDYTKMCKASTSAMNFVNFIQAETMHSDEGHRGDAVKFFKDFNLLLSEIVKEFVTYFQMASAKSPTAENIKKMQEAKKWIQELNGVSKTLSDMTDDEIAVAERAWWDVIKKGLQIAAPIVGALASDVSDDDQVSERSIFSILNKVLPIGIKLANNLLKGGDETQDDMETTLSGHLILSHPGTKEVLMKILEVVKSFAPNSRMMTTLEPQMELTTMLPEEEATTKRQKNRVGGRKTDDGFNFKIKVQN